MARTIYKITFIFIAYISLSEVCVEFLKRMGQWENYMNSVVVADNFDLIDEIIRLILFYKLFWWLAQDFLRFQSLLLNSIRQGSVSIILIRISFVNNL